VRYPLYEIEGGRIWGMHRRRNVLEVVEQAHGSELLYNHVIWQLVQDKWKSFGSRTFFWFVFVNLISLTSLTLSLCTAFEEVHASQSHRLHTIHQHDHRRLSEGVEKLSFFERRCDAVLFLTFVPVHVESMPAWYAHLDSKRGYSPRCILKCLHLKG
jgi:hypothetical protein